MLRTRRNAEKNCEIHLASGSLVKNSRQELTAFQVLASELAMGLMTSLSVQ